MLQFDWHRVFPLVDRPRALERFAAAMPSSDLGPVAKPKPLSEAPQDGLLRSF